MIDLNAAVGSWPFSAGWATSVDDLSEGLVKLGIERAYVSSMDAILASDPIIATRKLCEQIDGHTLLKAAAVSNPMLPTAIDDLTALSRNWPVKLVKLYPGLGRFAADDDRAAEVVKAAATLGMASAVVIRVLDDRNQPEAICVDPPTVDSVVQLAAKVAPLPLLALNAVRYEAFDLLGGASNLLCDIAFVESWSSLPDLIEHVGDDRVVFGTNSPVFYAQAATAKLTNPELTEPQRAAIDHVNVETWFTHL